MWQCWAQQTWSARLVSISDVKLCCENHSCKLYKVSPDNNETMLINNNNNNNRCLKKNNNETNVVLCIQHVTCHLTVDIHSQQMKTMHKLHIHCVSKVSSPFFNFCNNCPNCKPIQIIFGRNIAEKIWNKLTHGNFDICWLCVANLHRKITPNFLKIP